jgi:branched-chain amino acid transport system permease protein
MDIFVFSLLNGTVYGLLLFMVSAGLTLVFGMMGVLNFAHASFYMLGAYFAYTLQGVLGFGPAVVAATLLSGAVGVVVERWFLRRVHHHGHAHELLLTFGLSFIIAETIKLLFGNYPVDYRIPPALDFAAFTIGRQQYPAYRALIGAVAIGMFAALYLLLTRTRIGIVVRAAIYRPRMAQALGHNVQLVFMVASLLIGVMTSLAVSVDRSLADLLALVGAGAWARTVGGLMTLKLSSLAATLPFALMLLILLVRPSGLMGEKA